PLARPFIVFVHDQEGNPAVGISVEFQVTGGGGNLGGGASVTKQTGSDGRASVVLSLGPEPGLNNNVAQASFAGLAELPAVFIASGVIPGNPAATQISGVVLDNTNLPIEGVTVILKGTPLQTITNAQGQFTLTGVVPGTHHLRVEGATANRPGVWPALEFEIEVFPGLDNTLGMPIFLLPLDAENAKVVGGNENVTLTMKDVPGFSLTVFANSATFRDGSRTGHVMVTQVHADKVPMPPQQGAAPRLVWTVQPEGVVFDPPAKVTYPNIYSLNPGQVVELFSFDHDIGEFVSIGTGSVSADGSVITSDPGVGILKAGWGFPPPPPKPSNCVADLSAQIVPATKTLGVQQVGTLEAKGSLEEERDGCPSVSGTFTWSTSDTAVVTGADGVIGKLVSIVGNAVGTSTITVAYAAPGATAPPATTQVEVIDLEIFEVTTLSDLATPPSQGNTHSFVASRASFQGDQIEVKARVVGREALNNQIKWQATPQNAHTGQATPSTAEGTATFTFRGNSLLSTDGSLNANPALEYAATASIDVDGTTLTATFPGAGDRRISQDERDQIAQEYIDFQTVFKPDRSAIDTPSLTAFNSGNYQLIAEELAPVNDVDNLQILLGAVQEKFVELLNNDIQECEVGVQVCNGSPVVRETIVVSPGPPIVAQGRPGSATANRVDLGQLGDTDPEGDDECRVVDALGNVQWRSTQDGLQDGECNGPIRAGSNAIPETHANNRFGTVVLLDVITSAYRNPQRNKARDGSPRSRHILSRAFDFGKTQINLRANVRGKTTQQLLCILQAAGDEVLGPTNSFTEGGAGEFVPCDSSRASHVHVQN
ncbi:MAG: carboxypeptidase regulatory-like domain-containing protein, partial [Acidobacteria bacterium]|nr:carboxypeptidase regulatory-like domain-containing protein [Acidobacteriota bacterium]